jgi:hypothetical protein
MRRTILAIAVGAVLAAGCGEATTQPVLTATRGAVQAVIVSTPPRADGTLNCPIWQKCPPLVLGRCQSQETSPLKTTARVLFDATNLYVAWECIEPDTSALKVEAKARDEDAWNDDSVELFISADPREGHRHFAVNSQGVLQDWKGSPEGDEDLSWNSSATVKTSIEKNKRWIVTLSVPLKELGAYVGAGQTWSLNLNRTKPLGERQWTESSWSAEGRSKYTDSAGWGKITGVNIPRRADGVTRMAEPAGK